MLPEKSKTLKDFCEFIAKHANKEAFLPVKLLGNNCLKAGIFRTILRKLREQGFDTEGHLPSSPLSSILQKSGVGFIEVINTLSPGSLPLVDYQDNEWMKWGWRMFGGAFLILLVATVFGNWTIAGIGIFTFLAGIVFLKTGERKSPNKFEFHGIWTYRNLVEKIIENENKLKKHEIRISLDEARL